MAIYESPQGKLDGNAIKAVGRCFRDGLLYRPGAFSGAPSLPNGFIRKGPLPSIPKCDQPSIVEHGSGSGRFRRKARSGMRRTDLSRLAQLIAEALSVE
jgi:hypothetical protein